jgi:hypothetical protein
MMIGLAMLAVLTLVAVREVRKSSRDLEAKREPLVSS